MQILTDCSYKIKGDGASACNRGTTLSFATPLRAHPLQVAEDMVSRVAEQRSGVVLCPVEGQTVAATQHGAGNSLHSVPQFAGSEIAEGKYYLPQAWASFLDNDSYHWNWYGHFTFRDYPHPETADKAWNKFIHLLNRDCFGHYYWKDKSKGVTWARGTEDQKRGAIHFHAIIGNIPDRVDRMKYKEVWFDMAGISRIYAYEKQRGAEYYMSKSTYAWKKGEIDLSDSMKYHASEMVLPSGLR
jgi:hypothetical protein